MQAHLVRWPLEADEEISSFLKSDPDDIDLPRTMLQPDSSRKAGTPMPSNIAGI